MRIGFCFLKFVKKEKGKRMHDFVDAAQNWERQQKEKNHTFTQAWEPWIEKSIEATKKAHHCQSRKMHIIPGKCTSLFRQRILAYCFVEEILFVFWPIEKT